MTIAHSPADADDRQCADPDGGADLAGLLEALFDDIASADAAVSGAVIATTITSAPARAMTK